jgi:hypothetical protein
MAGSFTVVKRNAFATGRERVSGFPLATAALRALAEEYLARAGEDGPERR